MARNNLRKRLAALEKIDKDGPGRNHTGPLTMYEAPGCSPEDIRRAEAHVNAVRGLGAEDVIITIPPNFRGMSVPGGRACALPGGHAVIDLAGLPNACWCGVAHPIDKALFLEPAPLP